MLSSFLRHPDDSFLESWLGKVFLEQLPSPPMEEWFTLGGEQSFCVLANDSQVANVGASLHYSLEGRLCEGPLLQLSCRISVNTKNDQSLAFRFSRNLLMHLKL